MQLQAILFDKKYYTTKKAREYLKKHSLNPIKRVHKTENYFRYRLVDPDDFKTFKTKDNIRGIKFIIGYK